MTGKCKLCFSYAINHHCHGRDGTDGDLCDVCYWKTRAEKMHKILLQIGELSQHNIQGSLTDKVKVANPNM